jgi:serine/threonine protein kinase
MVDPRLPPRDFVSSSSLTSHTLAEGTRLLDFEITGLIGEGGFGIVYLAMDQTLGRRVAIKEYLPASMASRAHASNSVVLKSPRHEETFRLGLKSFVNEARLLARFDHPALVKVYRFWEENGTAYMAMPYYQGPTLKAALAELGRPPTEAELRGWLSPLLDALTVMHAAHCYHRDIAPDNILLTATGPLLLDFGAARRVIGDMTHALTVVLKPGFAPIEQYGEVPSLTQGAWTDLYALASVVYAAITRKAPVSAVERLIDDRHVPLAAIAAQTPGRYSESFVQAIDAALRLKPQDRPQDVRAFRVLLDGEQATAFADSARSPLEFVSSFGSLVEHDAEPDAEITQPPHSEAPPPDERTVPPPASAAAAVRPPIATQPAPGATARKTSPFVAAVALTGVLALAGAVWYWTTRPSSTESSSPAPSPSPLPSSTTTTTPAVADRTPTAVDAAPSSSPPAASALAPTPTPPTTAVDTTAPPTPAASTPPATRPRREPRPAATDTTVARPAPERAAPPPTNAAAVRAKCSDILQKASLEPLTADEAAFLRKECR